VNRSNAEHAVLFEAVKLIVHYDGQASDRLTVKAAAILGRYVQIRDANLRYLGLATMAKLASVNGAMVHIKKHQATILYGLKDADVTIRKRALNLVFLMCDKSNALVVVKELLSHLANADVSIREEMVLKIAILAERHAPNLKWYVDTILYIIRNSGTFIDDDIWHRACQIVSLHEELQPYAAKTMYEAIRDGTNVNEMLVRCAAYVLGEYGDAIDEDDGVTTEDIYDSLRSLWDHACGGNTTRSILLGSFAKLAVVSNVVETKLRDLLEDLSVSLDLELQQRALEFSAILDSSVMSDDQMEKILDKMPAFDADKSSNLVAAVTKREAPARQRVVTAPAALDEDEDEAEESEEDEEDEEDLIGMAEDVTFDPSEAPKMRKWFMNLVASNQCRGLLYDNAHVQIGVALSFVGKLAKIQLYYGNKSPSAMRNFRVEFDQIPELLWKIEGVKSDVEPKEQVRQRVQLVCVRPFAQSPRITVSFKVGASTHTYPLAMPVTSASFVGAKTMDSATFMSTWKSLNADGQTAQQLVPIDGRPMSEIAELLTGEKRLGLSRVTGIDRDPSSSVTCAGLFETKTVKVGCMLRVDVADGSFRVTVRSGSAVLSGAICKALSNLIKRA